MFRRSRLVHVAALCLAAAGCAVISEDQTAESLKATADSHVAFTTAVTPGNACPRVARMLMWCAGGPNYHYRCNISPDGGHAELAAALEAVYRTEFFMVTEFAKGAAGTEVKVHQRDSVLVYDYAPMIEAYLNANRDCRSR